LAIGIFLIKFSDNLSFMFEEILRVIKNSANKDFDKACEILDGYINSEENFCEVLSQIENNSGKYIAWFS